MWVKSCKFFDFLQPLKGRVLKIICFSVHLSSVLAPEKSFIQRNVNGELAKEQINIYQK